MSTSDSLPHQPYAGQSAAPDFPSAGLPNPSIISADAHLASLRQDIAQARRIVVKIGSSSLTGDNHLVDPARIDRFVDAFQARMLRGTDIIVVSSGAVAAGMAPLGLQSRPADLATKQAAAAVGQVHLAHHWARSFARYGRTVAQVLLTASDAGIRSRARNAQRTLDRLRRMRVVPIVNENDTVATAEFHFGDNDRLAALVAHLVQADALVLLSDVDGLYDRNPQEPGARFIPEVRSGHDLQGVVAGDGGKVGTGGMASKVAAARLAARGGVPVLLAAADNVGPALDDASVGTVFYPRDNRISAWKFWALHAADSTGVLRVDQGAMEAVISGGHSLLAVGITGVEGEFRVGDIVDITGPEGQLLGRGEVRFDAVELRSLIGKRSEELPEGKRRSVVHADYLSHYASRL
ncbi:glutamate 5-kinase [Corynebacterium poyangense]|uniref:Glutamate 5-kinase n=1 Tax=Corynebacterium poyangense TaxID=2684405 RepID=A0A7H0SQG0_9CORY|nr:glutamate 5-kinase [Corynebacterium poyangense]QNQ90785.1 glutamate 5-kinase [Corynebacterium poyangense]